MRRVAFKTIGCRLNQAETARMTAQFKSAAYKIVPFGEPCDACIIHTCAITKKAEKTCAQIARSVKRSSSSPPFIVMAGCAAELKDNKLLEKTGADMLAGQNKKFQLPELLNNYLSTPSSLPTKKDKIHIPQVDIPIFTTTRALVKVQDGCSFKCAYCIVPNARGNPVSRSLNEIVEEIHKLADTGYKEVVLTGANLGCYKNQSGGLIDLLQKIENIKALKRIRLSSIEMSTIEHSIIDYMAASNKLCNYIHIPLQSGDDRILANMGRRYTSSQYRNMIAYALKKIPLLGIGTDVLVGLPGEDKSAFKNTVNIIKDIPFNNIHVFPYSKRKGTRAYSMHNQTDEAEKRNRASIIGDLGKEKTKEFAHKFIGRKTSILIEKVELDNTGTGWINEYIRAKIYKPDIKINQIISFTPSKYNGQVLT